MTKIQILWVLATFLGASAFASSWWLGRRLDQGIDRQIDLIEQLIREIREMIHEMRTARRAA